MLDGRKNLQTGGKVCTPGRHLVRVGDHRVPVLVGGDDVPRQLGTTDRVPQAVDVGDRGDFEVLRGRRTALLGSRLGLRGNRLLVTSRSAAFTRSTDTVDPVQPPLVPKRALREPVVQNERGEDPLCRRLVQRDLVHTHRFELVARVRASPHIVTGPEVDERHRKARLPGHLLRVLDPVPLTGLEDALAERVHRPRVGNPARLVDLLPLAPRCHRRRRLQRDVRSLVADHHDGVRQVFESPVGRLFHVRRVRMKDDSVVGGEVPVQERVRDEHLESASVEPPVHDALARESIDSRPQVLAQVVLSGELQGPRQTSGVFRLGEVVGEAGNVPPGLRLIDQRLDDQSGSGILEGSSAVLVQARRVEHPDLAELPPIPGHRERLGAGGFEEITLTAKRQEPAAGILGVDARLGVHQLDGDLDGVRQEPRPCPGGRVGDGERRHVVERGRHLPAQRMRMRTLKSAVGVVHAQACHQKTHATAVLARTVSGPVPPPIVTVIPLTGSPSGP